MATLTTAPHFTPMDWIGAAGQYALDRWQRSILFWDVMRQRGNNYLAYIKVG